MQKQQDTVQTNTESYKLPANRPSITLLNRPLNSAQVDEAESSTRPLATDAGFGRWTGVVLPTPLGTAEFISDSWQPAKDQPSIPLPSVGYSSTATWDTLSQGLLYKVHF